MIVQSFAPTLLRVGRRSPVIKEERPDSPDLDCVPLDLSVHRSSSRLSHLDSGTESDDSTGRCSPENAKAYKKSLIKRYCKC